MKVLSCDQATRVSGYAFFEDGKYVASGIIDMTKSTLETDKRSFEMAKEIWKLMKKYQPDHLIIEDVQQQANPKTMIVLARFSGIIIGYAEAHKIKVHIVSPAKWRSELHYAQGSKVKRGELKKQSISYVKNHLGLDLPEDQAEAVCEGIAAHKIFKFE